MRGLRIFFSGLVFRFVKLFARNFERDLVRYRTLCEESLRRILRWTGKAKRGKSLGISNSEAFETFLKLPATRYEDYQPWIERIAKGEKRVMTTLPVDFFALSSGTTGAQKRIPMVSRLPMPWFGILSAIAGFISRAGMNKLPNGKAMLVIGEHTGEDAECGMPTGAASTYALRRFQRAIPFLTPSPYDVLRVRDQAASRYLHLLFALREGRLSVMASLFPAMLLFTLRDLHTKLPALMKDLEKGSIDAGLTIEPEIRNRLSKRLKPAKDAARKLSELLLKPNFTAKDVWPDLSLVLTATGGGQRFYVEALRPLLGDVPIYSPLYAASEAVLGIGVGPGEKGYLLLPYTAYVEFISADDTSARLLPVWEGIPGRFYEIVLTAATGLLRYRLGDIVRLTGFIGEAPVVEFIERTGQVIDLVGEKTSERHVISAFETAMEKVPVQLADYFVAPDVSGNPGRYLLGVEAMQADADFPERMRDFLHEFEAGLGRISPDYSISREMAELGPPAVSILPEGSFERWRAERIHAGASPAQLKTPHVVPAPETAAILLRGGRILECGD